MKKEITTEINNEEVIEMVEVKEKSGFKGLVAKVGGGIKKHGPKVLAGVGLVLGGALIGRAISGGSHESEVPVISYDVEDEIEESEYSEEVETF
jgi:hypothetical protein